MTKKYESILKKNMLEEVRLEFRKNGWNKKLAFKWNEEDM